MAKVSGSYESVTRGVSEQNAQSRRSGQHEAQVNMISDPVRGLARRHGSVMQDEVIVAAGTPEVFLEQTEQTRVVPFFVAGTEFDAILRTVAASDLTVAQKTLVQCFNKDTRKFIPTVLEDDTLVDALVAGGVSAAANVGRYLYLAGNTIVPSVTEAPRWDTSANKRLLAGWIRGGAYSRVFKATLTKADGSTVSGQYKTKASAYPGLLDTSYITIGTGDDAFNEYQKQINDVTNEYNSQVTAWIGIAAEDITPANIAGQLVAALVAAGVPSGEISAQGGYVVVNSATYVEITMTDSGDDSLVRSVGNIIENVDLVSSRHFVGKVLKVEPKDFTGDPVYLEAFAKDGESTGWQEVVWREAPGYLMTPDRIFAFATVKDGTLYVAGTNSGLATMTGITDVPGFEANKVGDAGSCPLPAFFNKRIDYLGSFADRLIIGSGSTLSFSRSSDYLNFFRKTVLSVEDDDPWEGYPLGAEDDTIRFSALYDRSLLLYGERFQYIVSGRTAFVPATANVAIASAYKDAVDTAPKTAGNFVFYCKYSGAKGREVSSLHQVQPGVVTDVSDSYPASQTLDSYLRGTPRELLTLQAPNLVLLRTSMYRNRVFTYSYLDNPNTNERLFDSWSHWEWAEALGSVCGMGDHKGDILIYMIRTGLDPAGVQQVWYAAELFVRATDLADYPYLDSLRPVTDYGTGSLSDKADISTAAVAFGQGVEQQFLGLPLERLDEFNGYYPDIADQAYVGHQYDSYVVPTNPFLRDRNDQAILSGRLTLGRVKVAVTDTAAMACDVTSRGITRRTLEFTGRVLGGLTNLVGRQPVLDTDLSAVIGGEVRECSYKLSSIKWLPLTINAIEWIGQSFLNTRRV